MNLIFYTEKYIRFTHENITDTTLDLDKLLLFLSFVEVALSFRIVSSLFAKSSVKL